MPEIKRVTLHPLNDDGTIDRKVNIYPKTLIDGIVDREGNPTTVAQQKDLENEILRAKEAEYTLQQNISDVSSQLHQEEERAFARENTIESQSANSLSISQDTQTGIVTISILNVNDEVLDTKTLDLETEKIITDIRLDYANSKLIFDLTDGTSIECDISDVIAAIDLKANNSEVVHNTGDETIEGEKTFTNKLISTYIHGGKEIDSFITIAANNNFETFITLENEGMTLMGTINPNDNYYGLTLPDTTSWTENKEIAIAEEPITKVESLLDVPNNELGLYTYDVIGESGEPSISSHIIEVVKEDHAGGEVSYEKTTTTNNTQLSTSTFMNQFDSELSRYINISSLTNIYALYYSAVPFNGIRVGTKNIGTIELNILQDCNVVIYKYFSYNGQTGVKTYDTNSKVYVNDESYEFIDDETPIIVGLLSGLNTIQSNGQNGRVILTAFEVSGEPYSTYDKKEIARVEEVEEVQSNLDSHISISNERFRQDESLIEQNTNDINLLNDKIGPIQIYQVYNNLPRAREEFLDKIYRYNEELYQCVKRGEGIHKEWYYNVTGTSEITLNTYTNFVNEIGLQYNQYLTSISVESIEDPDNPGSYIDIQVLNANKLYRNNGTIKLGSSSSVGYIQLINTNNLSIKSLKIGVKAYNSSKPSCIRIEDDWGESNTLLIQDNVEETIINVPKLEGNNLDSIYIETKESYEDTSGDEPVIIPCDKRIIITRIIADFGDTQYEWKAINENIIDITDGITEEHRAIVERDHSTLIIYDEFIYYPYYDDLNLVKPRWYGCFEIDAKIASWLLINWEDLLIEEHDEYSIEEKSNKVTSISDASTDIQYPSAKAVYDADVLLKQDIDASGHSILAAIDSSTFIMTLTLKDKNGNTLGNPQTIDLPLESVVVSGSYDSETKEVVLTLKDGSTIRFSVADLVDGLVSESQLNTKLELYYTKSETDTELDNKVSKTGDTMTGALTFKDTYHDYSIKASGSDSLVIDRDGSSRFTVGKNVTTFNMGDVRVNEMGTDTKSVTTKQYVDQNDQILSNNICLPYDNTTTYEVNDIAIHNNQLVRCTVAITEPEEFNAEHWTASTIKYNFVTKNGDQRITGDNVFDGNVTFNGGLAYTGTGSIIMNPSYLGVNNSEIQTSNTSVEIGTGSGKTYANRLPSTFYSTVGLKGNTTVDADLKFSDKMTINNEGNLYFANGSAWSVNIDNNKKIRYAKDSGQLDLRYGSFRLTNSYSLFWGDKTKNSIIGNDASLKFLLNNSDKLDMRNDYSTFYNDLRVNSMGTNAKSVTTKEYVEDRLSTKQDTLSTSSITSGTVTEAIGFDSSNNLVRGAVSGGMSNPMTTSQDIIVGGSSGTPNRLAKGNNGELLRVNSSGDLAYGNNLPIITTAPSADNTDGLIICVLSSEPATKYDGYLYIITGGNN